MVSAIVVNYNGEKIIRGALQGLMNQTLRDLEIIVVDNASLDNSVSLIQNEFKNVKLIKNPFNSGFTGGSVFGFQAAKGDFIALLNSDAIPKPDWLTNLVNGMNLDHKIGICASKMLIDGTGLIDSAGDGCTTASKGYKRGEIKSQIEYEQMEWVFGACGGASLYRRKMIDEIGFFDEEFFLIHEDTDLNYRAQLMGWKCLYVPKAVVFHKVRSTIKKDSDLAIYYTNRNANFVWIKNTPILLLLRFLHHKIFLVIGAFFFFGLRKKRMRLFIKSQIDSLKLFPKMLKKRRKIQSMRKVSNKEIRKLLTSIWDKRYSELRLWKLIKG